MRPAPFAEATTPSSAAARATWTSWQLAGRLDGDSVEAIAHVALRNKSSVVLDALASRAVTGGWTSAQLMDLELAGSGVAIRGRRAAAALALCWAGMGEGDRSMTAAAALYERLIESGEPARLTAVHQQAAAQSMFLSGRHDDTASLLPRLRKISRTVRAYLEADLASPAVLGGPPSAHWLHLLSARHVAHGLEPLRLEDRGDVDVFDRLDAEPAPATGGGALVSVVVPSFRPGPELLTSLRSLVNQTWEDTELLVVDDGSGPDHDVWYDRARDLDPRVRVIRLPANAGAYVARNRGILESRGTVVTFQDADDWSHPRRIERQIAPILDGDAVATRSSAIRARPDLTHQWFGYSPTRPNASSLMIRRSDLDRLGPFLEIRKGADSEYLERIEARAGELMDVREPLAVTRLRQGSLSRGDFTFQWSAPDRLDFRGSYRAWHRRDQGSSTPAAVPAFTVPTSFLREDARRTLDVVWVADLSTRAEGDDPRRLEEMVDAAVVEGRRHGWWHLESPLEPRERRPEMSDRWRDRIDASEVAYAVCRTDRVDATVVVVADPAVLLVATEQPTEVRAGAVEVWLRPEDLEPDAGGLPVDLLWVADQCRRWWSRSPRWVAAPDLGTDELDRVRLLAGDLALQPTQVLEVEQAREGSLRS